MQFIPSTWEWAGRDGNGDGTKDPNNIYDAALAAGHYLCRFDHDMSVQAQMNQSILSYNNSTAYLNTVLSWLEFYRKGTHEVPDGAGALPSRTGGRIGTPTARPEPPEPARPTPPAPSTPSAPDGGKPGPSPEPTEPATPAKPSEPATPPPTTPPATPTPTERVDHLAGTATKLTAMAGATFAQKITVRAEDSADKAVAQVRVRFTVVGDTDATFTGGESVAVVEDRRGRRRHRPRTRRGREDR